MEVDVVVEYTMKRRFTLDVPLAVYNSQDRDDLYEHVYDAVEDLDINDGDEVSTLDIGEIEIESAKV